MPELPEVETVKNELLPHVVGRQITGITLAWEGIVKYPSPQEFIEGVVGKTIIALVRRGKYLLFSLDSGKFMIAHLKMTGSLIVREGDDEPPKYTRATIHLDHGTHIDFRDPRKFGVLRLVDDAGSIVGKLGPEPFWDEFTPEALKDILGHRKAPMKALLCEQNLIAGIGSMYADEALFDTGIHPMRTGESLTDDEINRLHEAIIRILKAAVEDKGASVNTYYRPDGSVGTAHFRFKVAHRGKKPCDACGTPVERIVVRGRGSYYCPKCQKNV